MEESAMPRQIATLTLADAREIISADEKPHLDRESTRRNPAPKHPRDRSR